jgi:alpha-pyrone synthase
MQSLRYERMREGHMQQAWLTHLGYSLPGPAISQQEFATWMEPRLHPHANIERWRRFNARSGVSFRHSVLDVFGSEGEAFWPLRAHQPPGTAARSQLFSERALPLALAAVRTAIPTELLHGVTHVVIATCTGAVAPGLELQLVAALQLPLTVKRIAIGFMGCYAAVQALRVARDACRVDERARVLVVCCELSSLHLQAGPADDALLGACLFADGASAALVQSTAAVDGRSLRFIHEASAIIPDTNAHMAWSAGDHGFILGLSPSITGAVSHDLMPFTGELLGETSPGKVRWIVHPGGPRILDAVERTLDLPSKSLDSSRQALAMAGNRSSGTVLAILADELNSTWSGPLGMMAFGPGLTVEGLLLERV